jgi:Helix-turn-helix domain
MPADRDGLRFEWERSIRLLDLPATTKLVGLMLATYADGNTGGNAHPGQDRLAAECNLSERSVNDHLETLRHLGLLDRTYRGRANQYSRTADTYALTVPADVLTHVERWKRAVGYVEAWNAEHRADGLRYRNPRSSSKDVCCGNLATLLEEPPSVLEEPDDIGRGTPVPPINHVIKDVDQSRSNTGSVSAQTTGSTGTGSTRNCENCGHHKIADGECLKCKHQHQERRTA